MAQIHYTEAQINALLDTVNGITYTSEQINTLLQAAGLAAPKQSPTLTGSPKAPTAAASTNTTQIATTAFVQTVLTQALGQISAVLASVVEV